MPDVATYARHTVPPSYARDIPTENLSRSLFAELQKEATAKDEDARQKRKAYDDVNDRYEQLKKEAADAAGAQKQALKTRETLEKELYEFYQRLEKTETKLVEVCLYTTNKAEGITGHLSVSSLSGPAA